MAKNRVFIVNCDLFWCKNVHINTVFKKAFYQTRFSFYETVLATNNRYDLSFFFENQIQLHRFNVDIAP